MPEEHPLAAKHISGLRRNAVLKTAHSAYPNTKEEMFEWRVAEFIEKREKQIANLFDEIKHGDQEHRTWLKNKIEEHFTIKEQA